MDFVWLAVVIGLFAASWGLVRLFAGMREEG